MKKQNKSMLLLAIFTAFIALGLFFAGMTRTVEAAPPTLCNPCDELSTINGKVDAIEVELSTLDGGVGAIDTDLEAIETDLASVQDKLDTLDGSVDAIYNDVVEIKADLTSAQEKLDKVPPAWSQLLPASERFELVMDGAAVLDKETGLVWEQSPSIDPVPWVFACTYCNRRIVGNRKGWRLPTVEELASLVDPTNNNPALPLGHPFDVQLDNWYWTSTTAPDDPEVAWRVNFFGGSMSGSTKTNFDNFWCVRGGHGHDAY